MLPIPFGNPYTYPGHSGVDFPQSRGTIFRASGTGYVSSIDYGPRPGHTIWVQYDGPNAFQRGPNVGYCHMDFMTPLRRRGDRVWEGTDLGYVGSLGLFSTGPHLHVEVAGWASTAGFWRFFTPYRVVGAGTPSGGGSTPAPTEPPKDWFDMATEAELKRLLDAQNDTQRRQLQEALAPVLLAASGSTSFYKHGEMRPGVNLWIYVLENGDFVRIRDLATARLYKERNGGRQATTLSGAAIRLLVSDLMEAGGRDLSIVDDGTMVPTDPDQAVADAMQAGDEETPAEDA